MQNHLLKKLKVSLKDSKKIAILGIGSELRGDDIAGLLVAEQIKNKIKKNPSRFSPNFPRPLRERIKVRGSRVVKVFIGGTTPENLTGEIKKFNPTHLIIVDSANFKGKPGTVRILDKEEIGGVSFSTHMLPTSVMIDYLAESLKCEAPLRNPPGADGVTIIGIQPKTLEFGAKPTKAVLKSVQLISEIILKSIL